MKTKEQITEMTDSFHYTSEDISTNKSVLDTILSRLNYVMLKDVLVKPMGPTVVTKEIQIPKPTGEKDPETGAEIFDGTETKVEEFESVFREGIVLAIPSGIETQYKVGDKIVFHHRSATFFELFKDTMCIRPYDVIAIVK